MPALNQTTHNIKKEKLDEWYQTYEKEFENKREIDKTFDLVILEIISILPAIIQTRWKKKSDFYSLFMNLAKHVDLLPFSQDGRNAINGLLATFGGAVDDPAGQEQSLYDTELDEGLVASYAVAVGRAASDLGNRRARDQVLDSLLSDVIASEKLNKASRLKPAESRRSNVKKRTLR